MAIANTPTSAVDNTVTPAVRAMSPPYRSNALVKLPRSQPPVFSLRNA